MLKARVTWLFMSTASDIINVLKLEPHIEGGFYRRMFKSAETILLPALPSRYTEDHKFASSIYYLLTRTTCSKMHRLKSDETYHFYLGASVELLVLYPNGDSQVVLLGSNILSGEVPQFTVPQGSWQGSRIKTHANDRTEEHFDFTLMGTTVYPAFEYSDFEFGDKNSLIESYPEHRDLIELLS
jgi:predicted cupin superfamily sugar epimerase